MNEQNDEIKKNRFSFVVQKQRSQYTMKFYFRALKHKIRNAIKNMIQLSSYGRSFHFNYYFFLHDTKTENDFDCYMINVIYKLYLTVIPTHVEKK